MKQALKVSKDAELARVLSIRQSSLSTWQKRGNVPYAEAIRVAEMTGVSTDYLFGLNEPKGLPLDREVEEVIYNVAYFLADKADEIRFKPERFADGFLDLCRFVNKTEETANQSERVGNVVEFQLDRIRRG